MANKDPTTTVLDLLDVKVCNSAIQKLLHSRPGYKSWFNKPMQPVKVNTKASYPMSYVATD